MSMDSLSVAERMFPSMAGDQTQVSAAAPRNEKGVGSNDTVGRTEAIKPNAEGAPPAASPAPQIKPEDIQIALPENFQVPDGYSFEVDAADPQIASFKAFAVENNLDQETVSKLLAFEAQRTIARDKAEATRLEGERARLGENAAVRISGVESYLKANVSPDEYQAAREIATTAAGMQLLEKLIAKANGGTLPGPGANTHQVNRDLASRLFPSMR